MSTEKNHDLSPAEERAINDLRTATRKVYAAFSRNDLHLSAEELLRKVNETTAMFDLLAGTSHKPLSENF